MKHTPFSPQKAVLTPQDLECARQCLDADYEPIMAIVRAVAEASNVPQANILGRYRGKASIARARQIVMYVANRAGFSLSAIGRALRRDHATIKFGIEQEKKRRGEA